MIRAKANESKVTTILERKRRSELKMEYKSATRPRKIKIPIQDSKGIIIIFQCALKISALFFDELPKLFALALP